MTWRSWYNHNNSIWNPNGISFMEQVFFRSNPSKMLKSLILDGINFLFDIFILGNFNFRAQILILKTAVYLSKIRRNRFTQIVTTYYL